MKRKRRTTDVARVRIPEDQAPFVFVPGEHGGWFLSLLWHFGSGLDVPTDELRRLLARSKGEVFIGRRLKGAELKFFERYRNDIDHEVHARLIFKNEMRWRRPFRSTGRR